MRAWIQKNPQGDYANVNYYLAADGFRSMGWEVRHFERADRLQGNQRDEVVVGGIDEVRTALRLLGIDAPHHDDYPAELLPFLGRKVWKASLHSFGAQPQNWPVFLKPADGLKKFTGKLVRSHRDLIGIFDQGQDTQVWCSEPVHFLAEWRTFVRYGTILDVRRYTGTWKVHYDPQVIEAAEGAFATAPKAYAIDFGVTSDGRTLLVEVNEGHSIGAYGLTPLLYAKLLSARWAEMTGAEDYCAFDV
jgi:hypothetical protein